MFQGQLKCSIDDEGYVVVSDLLKMVYGSTGTNKVKHRIKDICPKRKNRKNVVHETDIDRVLQTLMPPSTSHTKMDQKLAEFSTDMFKSVVRSRKQMSDIPIDNLYRLSGSSGDDIVVTRDLSAILFLPSVTQNLRPDMFLPIVDGWGQVPFHLVPFDLATAIWNDLVDVPDISTFEFRNVPDMIRKRQHICQKLEDIQVKYEADHKLLNDELCTISLQPWVV